MWEEIYYNVHWTKLLKLGKTKHALHEILTDGNIVALENGDCGAGVGSSWRNACVSRLGKNRALLYL